MKAIKSMASAAFKQISLLLRGTCIFCILSISQIWYQSADDKEILSMSVGDM